MVGRTVVGAAVILGAIAVVASRRTSAVPVPAVAFDPAGRGVLQSVVFSGGCFWGVQGVFQRVQGVRSATSGYAGGDAETARYGLVGTGRTGHAESVLVVFDPAEVTFGQLLEVFFSVVHDPTELNRQGPDVGTEYRSAIWYTADEQRDVARRYIAQLTEAKTFSRPIVTEVNALGGFYPAEDYHQNYLIEHPRQPYIVFNDIPKVEALKREFPRLWRDEPAPWRAERTAAGAR